MLPYVALAAFVALRVGAADLRPSSAGRLALVIAVAAWIPLAGGALGLLLSLVLPVGPIGVASFGFFVGVVVAMARARRVAVGRFADTVVISNFYSTYRLPLNAVVDFDIDALPWGRGTVCPRVKTAERSVFVHAGVAATQRRADEIHEQLASLLARPG